MANGTGILNGDLSVWLVRALWTAVVALASSLISITVANNSVSAQADRLTTHEKEAAVVFERVEYTRYTLQRLEGKVDQLLTEVQKAHR